MSAAWTGIENSALAVEALAVESGCWSARQRHPPQRVLLNQSCGSADCSSRPCSRPRVSARPEIKRPLVPRLAGKPAMREANTLRLVVDEMRSVVAANFSFEARSSTPRASSSDQRSQMVRPMSTRPAFQPSTEARRQPASPASYRRAAPLRAPVQQARLTPTRRSAADPPCDSSAHG